MPFGIYISFSLYLVDSASNILISKIKSCISVHGQYNETEDSSLNQLWLLWSLDYFLKSIYFFNWRLIVLQNFVFFSVKHRQESAIGTPCPLPPELPCPSNPSRLSQSPCLSSLRHTANFSVFSFFPTYCVWYLLFPASRVIFLLPFGFCPQWVRLVQWLCSCVGLCWGDWPLHSGERSWVFSL